MADGGGPRGWKRALVVFVAVLGTLVVYAYGFEVTDVSLEEIRSERRRQGLVRILRALARPDLITYEEEQNFVDAPIMVPCPDGGFEPPPPDTDGPAIVVDPPCADPRADVTVEGFGFEPGQTGTLNFVPTSEVTLRRGEFRADRSGRFETTINLPARPDEEVQTIRALTIDRTGDPQLTRTARDTWDKIIETVFLALLATTLGTALAVPLSFVAARNLMRDISTPLTTLALSLLAVPLGVLAGMEAADWARTGAGLLSGNPLLLVAGLVVLPVAMQRVFRWALPPVETSPPSRGLRLARALALVAGALGSILVLYLLGFLAQMAGMWAQPRLGGFGFLGKFLRDVGDIMGFGIGLLAAIFGAGAFVSLAGRLGTYLRRALPLPVVRLLGLLLAGLAGAVVMVMVGAAVAWLYETRDPTRTLWIPAGVGVLAGLALALRAWRRGSVHIGLSIYYIARTIFNTLRSIEPLVMVLVFVVWVGIGPFAGMLALALHTIAALAKLYSEQVESILPGPLEAVRATGATRLQTVVYAVFPQIIPPYISFTMYRWDINVRMSTIIGFAGGGGIGFLLQQNINLLNYRAAAAQMLAIAVVVASMDYLSSRLRERFV